MRCANCEPDYYACADFYGSRLAYWRGEYDGVYPAAMKPTLGLVSGDKPLPDPRAIGESVDPLLHEVIRQLSELRQQTGDVVVRLTRIEANSVHGDIERLRAELATERARVDALMRDKDRRDGAIGAAAWLHKSGPWALFMAAGAAIAAWFRAPA